MNVLHITPYMHPSAGGPPVVVEQLCLGQARLGWGARCITTAQLCDDDGRELQRALRTHIDVTVLPVDRPRLLGSSSRAEAAIGAGVRDADIVHLHTLWHPLNGIARQAAKAHGKPYVLMPHGMLDPYSLGVRAFRKRAYLALVENHTLRHATRVLFTTELEETLTRRMLPWLGPATILPLGAQTPPAGTMIDALQQFLNAYPQTRGRRCLLFLARLHPKKGLERILDILPEVIRAVPGAMLVAAGAGEAEYVAKLKARTAELRLTDDVLFTGQVQGALKWGAFASAEAFLLPSHQENFAIAVAEAMHLSIPVIISDKVNIWPTIEAAKAGFVVPEAGMAAGLLAAMLDVLSRPEAARQMGRNGRAAAQAHFTWAAAARASIACYEAVLAERQSLEGAVA